MTRKTLTADRRQVLKGLGAAGGAAAAASLGLLGQPRAQVPEGSGTDPRFLIVMGCSGGASIIDGALAIRASECSQPQVLNTFPDALVSQPDGSPLRAVDQDFDALGNIPAAVQARQGWFVQKHHAQMAVATWERTSVNHAIGQRRAVTGNEAWAGRTLQECVALQHGAGRPLPNVHLMGGSGFTERGTDASLPAWAFGEAVTDPRTWPLSLDAVKGIQGAPGRGLFDRARALRDGRVDALSRFAQVFDKSTRLRHWRHIRSDARQGIEALDLISKLMLKVQGPDAPLAELGLTSSPVIGRVREVFPNLENDKLEAQAALAFLLIKYGVSVTVTLGPGGDFVLDPEFDGFSLGAIGGGGGPVLPVGAVKNPPIAFDFSHNGHRSVQAFMWDRMYKVADGLITLLAEEEFGGGQSYWDRSLIYFASDFGRDKHRPEGAPEFGTGHSVNNGVLALSPLIKGDTVLGGVDPETGLTYGCDPRTGAPEAGRKNSEAEVFSGLLSALKVDTAGSGLPDFSALPRG
ncbi:MAG: twin-arginine translocation signal domain-containing protein [Myxococcales bacterium]|nr:twin-arginine translocation signal domain-containing protein [Myxococcales bacterium]MCB9523752.1 twin-arginine translocation signal domain-containing protein [Myxococcales bacterium]